MFVLIVIGVWVKNLMLLNECMCKFIIFVIVNVVFCIIVYIR